MTRWGVFLLLLFFVLGLSGMKAGKAMTVAVCVTALVVTGVMASYVR
jgi:hypothetical protein